MNLTDRNTATGSGVRLIDDVSEEPVPTRDDYLTNGKLAIEEIRRHIDHQVTGSDLIDSKAQATFGLLAVGATLLGSRTHLTDVWKTAAALFVYALAFAVGWCAWRAMQPRGRFSYGPDAPTLVQLATDHPQAEVALAVAQSLGEARDRNVDFLDAKQEWLRREYRLFGGSALAVVIFAMTGAVQ